jgi:hypothetical protein
MASCNMKSAGSLVNGFTLAVPTQRGDACWCPSKILRYSHLQWRKLEFPWRRCFSIMGWVEAGLQESLFTRYQPSHHRRHILL